MGFGALASLVAHRPGLGLRIVVIRIVVIRIGRVLMRTERITILLRSAIWRLDIYLILRFQNGTCFHDVADENTLRHKEVM